MNEPNLRPAPFETKRLHHIRHPPNKWVALRKQDLDVFRKGVALMSVADVRKEINEAESKRGGHSPEEVLDHVFNALREMARLLEELEKRK
jgi:hypothetical protein